MNLPHNAIEELEENLWAVEGIVPKTPLKRRMSIIRLSDGRLLFHSPMLLEESAMQYVESLGTPAFAVIPNGYHRIDAANYAKRYPEIRVIAPQASLKKVAQVVRVDGDYETLPSDSAFDVETLDGGKVGEGVFIVHSTAGTSLVFNDTIFNIQEVESGFSRFLLRMVGSLGGPKVTPTGRFALVKDKKALGAHLERLSTRSNLRRLIPGHGDIVTANVAQALREAARPLM